MHARIFAVATRSGPCSPVQLGLLLLAAHVSSLPTQHPVHSLLSTQVPASASQC